MLRRIVLVLIILPVSLALIALAVANRHGVTLVLDPFAGAGAFAVEAPLFVVLFATLILGVLLGGLAMWVRQGRFRRAARQSGREARRATAQANELRAMVAPARPAGPHGAGANSPGNFAALPDRRSAA